MKIRFLQFVFVVGVALAFNACGNKVDESIQNSIQEEQYSESETQEQEDDGISSQDVLQESTETEASNDSVLDEETMSGVNSIDTFIESKIISGGVLSLTEDEFSREIASRIIERRITFTITHLSNRDKTIKELEGIMKEQGETYRVVKEDRPGVMGVITNTATGAIDGATIGGAGGTFIFPGIGSFLGGVFGGALGGVGSLAYSLKDYIGDVFAKDTNWLISKSPDESVLNIKRSR